MIVKMAVIRSLVAFSLLLCSSAEACSARAKTRPKIDPFCQPLVPFCSNGRASMPKVNASDTMYVYAMKAPFYQDIYGNFLGKVYHLMQDAIGFHHVQSGANITVERVAMGNVLNATFPHERSDRSLVWCNQGATCFSMGIDERRWKENGTLVKVAEINGTVFNNFVAWAEKDNSTNVFYETFTIWHKPQFGHDATIKFEPCDSATWVQTAYQMMARSGASFNRSIRMNYTRINVYSYHDENLGKASNIHMRDWEQILYFYNDFQHRQSVAQMMAHVYHALHEMSKYRLFYLYYDEEYYRVHLAEPFFNITYDYVPWLLG